MPCNQNVLSRFFGSGSSNSDGCFSGSSFKKEPWCDKKPTCIDDLVVFPHRERHELIRKTCGVHRVPFFTLSSVFFDAVLRHVQNNKTPTIHNVDELTFFPVGATGDYLVGASGGVGTETVIAQAVNVDSHVHLQIPRCAADGIVVDLNELSTFANSIYVNQVSETRDETLPGSGYHLLPGTITPVLADGFQDLGVTSSGPTGTADFSNGDCGFDSLRLLHVPEVTIYNDSRHNVYVVDGYGNCGAKVSGCGTAPDARRKSALFEGVMNRIGCKPRESLCLVYLPHMSQWRVKDTNSRA